MKAENSFKTSDELSEYFQKMHEERKKNKQKNRRKALSIAQRKDVLAKTKGLCHICGGEIGAKEAWQADHISPHIYGGSHSVDNYLPAHPKCNRSRWLYGPEEFQLILDLGIWVKTKVEDKNKPALKLVEGFVGRKSKRKT